MEITLQYFEECPNWRVADDRIRQALKELGREDQTIRYQRVETPEEADRVGFSGSPTILVDGVDPFPDPAGPAGFACRVYAGDAAPTREQLRLALARHVPPSSRVTMTMSGAGGSLTSVPPAGAVQHGPAL